MSLFNRFRERFRAFREWFRGLSRVKKIGFIFSALVIVASPIAFLLLRPSPKVQEVSSIEELFPEIAAPEEEPGEETFSSIRGEYTNNSIYTDSVKYSKHYLIPSRITDTETTIRCKLYKSNLDTLLEFYGLESHLYDYYGSWGEREEAVNRSVDVEKLSLVQEWEEQSEEEKPWVLVSLPVSEVGIYYLKLEHPDLPQPYGVHIVLNRYFLATQLGVTGGVIWALDMVGVKDQPRVGLTFYDTDNGIKKIRGGMTNEKGLFPISSLKPFSEVDVVVGRYNGDIFLATFNFSEISEFRAHLETDLPLYKPGDTVRFSGIVWREDKGSFSPVGEKSAVARLECGWGVSSFLIKKSVKVTDGVFDTTFVLDKKLDFDYCHLDLVLEGEVVQNKYIEVTKYVKPTFEVNAWVHQEEYFPEEAVKFDVEAKHLSGAPTKGTLKWEIHAWNFTETWREEDYDPYDLSDECRWWWEAELASSGQTDLDDNGKATVSYKPDMTRFRESAAVCLSAKVTDLAEESHTSYAGVVVHQGDFKLLVEIEEWFGYLPPEGGKVTVPLVIRSLNHQDESIPVSGIKGGVYLLREDEEGNILSRQIKGVFTVDTDQSGEALFDYIAKEAGIYEVEVTAKDSEGRLIRGTTSFYVSREEEGEPGPGYDWSYPGGSIDLEFDGEYWGWYEVGDAAKISFYKWAVSEGSEYVRGKLEGRALVAVQTKSEFTYEFRNLGEIFQIPIKLKHVPGFSIGALMVDGEGMIWQGGGEAEVMDPGQKQLQVEATSNKPTYGVREQAQVNLQLRNNKGGKVPGQIMLSVTDKAVFEALEERWGEESVSPDNQPYDTFYGYFGTWISLSHSLEQSLTFLWGMGGAGGGGGGGEEEPERIEFLDTAYWNPRIATDANGVAKISFELPDNLTTWYIYAIGLTKNVQVGSEVAEIKVYQEVFLDPRLAASYSVDEEVTIKGTLHNFTENSHQFDITLTGEGFEVLEGGSQVKEVESNDTVGLSWKVRIGDVSEATFKFSATDGEVGDSIQLKRSVHPAE